jgi:hypothetical protein
MKRILIALCILTLTNGCNTVAREAGYPGGNLGFLADRHSVFAKGQKQQVNRYILALALLAPLVAETVEGSSEAKLSAERIKDLYGNIEKLKIASKKCALPAVLTTAKVNTIDLPANCTEAEAKSEDGSALTFETLSFEVSRSLNGALKQTYDNLEIRGNASRILALEPTEMFRIILKARHFVPVILRYLSTYRDVSIVFGLSIAESCAIHKRDHETSFKALGLQVPCKGVTDSYAALINRTRTDSSDVAKQERPISDLFKAGKRALDAGLDWDLSKPHSAALFYHVSRACTKLDALAKIDYSDFTGCTIKEEPKLDEEKEIKDSVDTIIDNQEETTP